MGLLDKIKSFLGGDDGGQPGPGHETAGADGGANVTVEREPTGGAETRAGIETETEATVKGVEPTADATPETEAPDTDEDTTGDATGDDPEAETAAAAGDGETGAESEPVETVKGIGSTYADRLAGAGVETVADLLAADAGDVAETTDISQSRLETWQERARD